MTITVIVSDDQWVLLTYHYSTGLPLFGDSCLHIPQRYLCLTRETGNWFPDEWSIIHNHLRIYIARSLNHTLTQSYIYSYLYKLTHSLSQIDDDDDDDDIDDEDDDDDDNDIDDEYY